MKSHADIDARSLAFGRAVAERLRTNETAVLAKARENVSRWLRTCSPGVQPVLLEWQAILEGPLEGVFAALADTSEAGVQRRQSSPFAGVLTQAERTTILMEFDDREPLRA